VGELESLTRAASACGIAQPNASRTIGRLERQLGHALVVRSSTGSRLTPTGALVAQWASPLLSGAVQFTAALASLGAELRHELAILASQTVAECYAPRWLAEYHRTRPDTAVRMSVHNSTQIMDALSAGDERLGLVETPTLRPGLARRLIGHDQLVVVVGRGHAWARRRRPLSLAQLAVTSLVVREQGSGTRETLDRALARFDPVPPELVVSSNAGVLASVAAGAGPAVLSERAVSAAVSLGQVRPVPVDEPQRLRRPLHAVWNPGAPLLGAASELLALVQAASRPTGAPRSPS